LLEDYYDGRIDGWDVGILDGWAYGWINRLVLGRLVGCSTDTVYVLEDCDDGWVEGCNEGCEGWIVLCLRLGMAI